MNIVVSILGFLIFIFGISMIKVEPRDFLGYFISFAGLFICFILPEKARELWEKIKKHRRRKNGQD